MPIRTLKAVWVRGGWVVTEKEGGVVSLYELRIHKSRNEAEKRIINIFKQYEHGTTKETHNRRH